jgi:hypothetical protein
MPHIADCLGFRPQATPIQVMLAYTSSGPWQGGPGPRPMGILEFDSAAAAHLNQRAFHLELRCLAAVSLTEAWFPRLHEAEHGIRAWADRSLQTRINQILVELARRSPHVIQFRGIGSV